MPATRKVVKKTLIGFNAYRLYAFPVNIFFTFEIS